MNQVDCQSTKEEEEERKKKKKNEDQKTGASLINVVPL
jgi:hypothetical protein